MKTIRKACALVVREREGRRELLQLLHPETEPQMPKGGIEPNESPLDGVLRELHEESGLTNVAHTRDLGLHSIVTPGGALGDGPLERQDWYLFLVTPDGELPDEWTHCVEGDGEDRGLAYGFRWVPVDAQAPDAFHPLFRPVVERLLAL